MTLLFTESNSYGAELADTSGFVHVRNMSRSLNRPTMHDAVAWIRDQRFDAIFFPELGMHPVGVLLANQRLAPLQIASYGHSSSSHGAMIDFFVGGEEVEYWERKHGSKVRTRVWWACMHPFRQEWWDQSWCQRVQCAYACSGSRRGRPLRSCTKTLSDDTLSAWSLSQVPADALTAPWRGPCTRYPLPSPVFALRAGLGIVFDERMPVHRPEESLVENRSTIYINCPWTVIKINAPFLSTLSRIVYNVHYNAVLGEVPPPHLVFRVFAGLPRESPLQISSLRQEIQAAIRGHLFPDKVTVIVMPHMGSDLYLQTSATAHLALDSYPFGGCNTVMVRAVLPYIHAYACVNHAPVLTSPRGVVALSDRTKSTWVCLSCPAPASFGAIASGPHSCTASACLCVPPSVFAAASGQW